MRVLNSESEEGKSMLDVGYIVIHHLESVDGRKESETPRIDDKIDVQHWFAMTDI